MALDGAVADLVAKLKDVAGASPHQAVNPTITGGKYSPYWDFLGAGDSNCLIFAATTDNGMDVAPVALVRRWQPPEGKQPTLGGLKKSLVDKYGEPSSTIHPRGFKDARPFGSLWSYDTSGKKLEGLSARYCAFKEFSRGDDISKLPARGTPYAYDVGMVTNGHALADVAIGYAPGCGYQLMATWLETVQDMQVVQSFAVALVDAQGALANQSARDEQWMVERLAPLLKRFNAGKAGAGVAAPL